MDPNPTLDEAVRRWLSLKEQGRSAAIRDLCADCPDDVFDLSERLRVVVCLAVDLGIEAGGRITQDATAVWPESGKGVSLVPRWADLSRDLLFGLLALQNGMVTRDQLIAAFAVWNAGNRRMADLLAEQGGFGSEEQALVTALVENHLRRHAGGAARGAGIPGLDRATCDDPAAIGSSTGETTLVDCDPGLDIDPDRTVARGGNTGMPAGQRFRVLRLHAKGGLGAVYVALDEELHREVALKRIRDDHADDPASRQRFLLEAEITGSLEHPGIVPVYSLGISGDGRPYYAMRLIRGDSLRDVIARFHTDDTLEHDPGKRSLALRALLRRFIGVCDAIEYAHSRGVLHRDLKPGNVIVGHYGETLVIDWGLAKAVGRSEPVASDEQTLVPSSSGTAETLPGSALGTPAYMSPEQARGERENVGPRSDVYSLGATLYCLLTGKAPFRRDKVAEVLRRVRIGDFPSPRSLEPSVDKGLEAICLKAMAIEPDARYASCRALVEDIERWLADEPVSVRRETKSEMLSRWARRRRAWVQSGVAALVVAVAVSTTAAVLVNRARRSEHEGRQAAVRLAARLALDNGLALCERGERGRGMLGLAKALPLAEAVDDRPLSEVIRTNLASWRSQLTELRAILPHDGPVVAMAFSPDGSRILSGCEVGSASLSDARTGDRVGTPMRRPRKVGAVAFTPDSKSAAVGYIDGHVEFLDARTGRQIRGLLLAPGGLTAMAFSPDGKTFFAGGLDGSLQLWDTATLRPVGRPMRHSGEIVAAAFSPDGRRIASGSRDGIVRLWDPATQDAVGGPLVHAGEVTDLGFGPGGALLITGSHDRTARIWDAETGRPVGPPLRHENLVLTVALSPDGRTAATGGAEGSARLWDLRDPDRAGRVLRHGNWVFDLTFTPDGRTLMTASADNRGRLWDVKTGTLAGSPLVHGSDVSLVAISPDGQDLLTGSKDHTARLWRLPSPPEPPVRIASPVGLYKLELAPGPGLMLASDVDGVVRLWDQKTGSAAGPPLPGAARDCLRFSPDGSILLTSGGPTRLWRDARNRPVSVLVPTFSEGLDAAFRPDGKAFAIGYRDGSIRIWETETMRPIGVIEKAHKTFVLSVTFSPDGSRIASGGSDGVARTWDAKTLLPLGPPLPHEGYIHVVRFGKSGRFLLTGGSDMTVQVWDAATGRPVGTPLSQPGAVAAAMLSPDDRLVLTGCADGSATFWHVATSKPVGPRLVHGGDVHAVDFAPDGRTAQTAALDGTIHRWPVPEPMEGSSRMILTTVQHITGLEGDPSGVTRAVPALASKAARSAEAAPTHRD